MSPPGKAAANTTHRQPFCTKKPCSLFMPLNRPLRPCLAIAVPYWLACSSQFVPVPPAFCSPHSLLLIAGSGFQTGSAPSLLGLRTQRKALALSPTSFIWFTKQVCVKSLALQNRRLLLALLKSQPQLYAYGLHSLPLPPAVLGSEFWDAGSPKASWALSPWFTMSGGSCFSFLRSPNPSLTPDTQPADLP